MERLTDESLIELVVRYDRLGGEAKERKKRTCRHCGAVEDHELYPRRMLCEGCLARDREMALARAEDDERARRAEWLKDRAAAADG